MPADAEAWIGAPLCVQDAHLSTGTEFRLNLQIAVPVRRRISRLWEGD